MIRKELERGLDYMKKFKGFTLIELIVVIAIVGVLCALLIPTMMGWTTKSRISTNNSNAKELYNGLMATCTVLENEGGSIKSGILSVNCNSIEAYPNFDSGILSDDECKELFKSVDDKFEDTSKCKWAACFDVSDASVLTAVVYAQKTNRYCGGYPVICPEEAKYATGSDANLEDCLSYASGDSSWPQKN